MRRGRGSKRKGLHLTAPPLLSPPRDPQIGLSSLSVAAAAEAKPPSPFPRKLLIAPAGKRKEFEKGKKSGYGGQEGEGCEKANRKFPLDSRAYVISLHFRTGIGANSMQDLSSRSVIFLLLGGLLNMTYMGEVVLR